MKEVISEFSDKVLWEKYVSTNMKNAFRFDDGSKVSIQSGGRVLGEWSDNCGFVSEGRTQERQ